MSDNKALQRASFVFLIAVALYIFGPFMGIVGMSGMVGDTMIQIKAGLDTLSSGHFILDEIYSWHEGLKWTAHESGWYVLLGFAYKTAGLWGVIGVGCLFNYLTAMTSVWYLRDKAHPMISAAVMIILTRMAGFPDYNVRPSVTSAAVIAILIVVTLSDTKSIYKAVVFSVGAFVLAWLHGGISPLYFAVYAGLTILELFYKEFKDFFIMLAGIPVGFGLTLLNPIGFEIWSFGAKQAGATDIWAYVDEWQPKSFSVIEIIMVVILIAGFIIDERTRKFDKKTITKICLIVASLVLTCIYKRFMLYFTVMYLLFAPEELDILIKWIVKKVSKKDSISLSLSSSFYYILAGLCAVIFIGSGVYLGMTYLPSNSMTDIEKMAAYDHGAVDVILAKDYKRIYNSFDTGSWLLFNGIKVHIDNRIDPFMEEYSGVDHIRGTMFIGSIEEMDSFRQKYDNDAFLLTSPAPQLVDYIGENCSDRYEVVYDNTVSSNIVNGLSIRWVIVECR